MAQVLPYVNFGGKAREAMTFYKECFGGELSIMTGGDTPMAGEMPPQAKSAVFHSCLTAKDGMVLMASDMEGPEAVKPGNNISLAVVCHTDDEIRTLFAKLSAGGKVIMPLGDAFWDATFGCLEDKFGLTWSLNHQKTPPA